MPVADRVKDVLTRNLPNAIVKVDLDPDTGKVGGHVIWEGFAGYSSLRRQNRVVGLLRRELNAEEQRAISFIFTYTPSEYDADEAA